MTRDERTIGEAEAERRGYERARRQTLLMLRIAIQKTESEEVYRALVAAAEAIARMQPGGAP